MRLAEAALKEGQRSFKSILADFLQAAALDLVRRLRARC
jgi:hypothetical protein